MQCKQRALDFSKSREKLLLEKQSLDVERMDLIAEIESERAGNEEMRRALAEEREARATKEAEIQAMSGTYQSLVEQLETELRAGEIEIEELRGRLQVRALDQILFDSGSVEIKPRGREVLAKVATQLAKVSDRRVRVEGHTDDRPIATPRFPSNWELSVGRAATVARFLADHGRRAGAPRGERLRPVQPDREQRRSRGSRAQSPHRDRARAARNGVNPRALLADLHRAALDEVHAGRALARALEAEDPGPGPFVVLAAGKAACAMAEAARAALGARIARGAVTTKDGHARGIPGLEVREAAHPLPDARSERAGREALALASGLSDREELLVLISGGASSLWCAPAPGLALAEKRAASESLLRASVGIRELNAVRKHLSALKGRRPLARDGGPTRSCVRGLRCSRRRTRRHRLRSGDARIRHASATRSTSCARTGSSARSRRPCASDSSAARRAGSTRR